MDPRGRSCPLAYRYQPEALAGPAQLEAETLYVVGGLYGNLAALRAVLERADREPGGPATVAFNGDFHWLDVDPQEFEAISAMVMDHHATMGNVEAELASQGSGEDAGCGCAYPDYISDEVVDRSNQIMTRLSDDPRPPADSLYGVSIGGLRGDALPVRFDPARWTERFLAQWPPGSPGHRSYFTRITHGTHLQLHQAARDGVQLTGTLH